mmetsp:Transcript_43969/g.72425  ORF Transcript_43969/g.72425 Transcript_43969/m.72425 type:complete len:263 (-) Transcript_43969:120-908(-)
MLDLFGASEGFKGSCLGAISANDKVLLDVLFLEHLGDVHVWRISSVADEDGAALLVDVLHNVWGQLHPCLWLHHAFISPNASKDILHAIGCQGHDNFTNDGIQSRAKASTGHNDGRAVGWVKVECLTRSTSQKLQIVPSTVVPAVVAHQGLCGPTIRPHGHFSWELQRVRHLGRWEVVAQIHHLQASNGVTCLEYLVDTALLGKGLQHIACIGAMGFHHGRHVWGEVGLLRGFLHAEEPAALGIHTLALLVGDGMDGQVAVT